MKAPALLVLSMLAVPFATLRAETVYRCDDQGRTIFTETAAGPSCRALEIKDHPADPGEVERQRRELEDWNRRREAEVQRSLSREIAAKTQRRQDELAALGRDQARTGDSGPRARGSKRRSGGGRSQPNARQAAPAAMAPDLTATMGSRSR